jgi:hypothetical protein
MAMKTTQTHITGIQFLKLTNLSSIDYIRVHYCTQLASTNRGDEGNHIPSFQLEYGSLGYVFFVQGQSDVLFVRDEWCELWKFFCQRYSEKTDRQREYQKGDKVGGMRFTHTYICATNYIAVTNQDPCRPRATN